jgi:L-lactate dehydrogenase complex protein LldG
MSARDEILAAVRVARPQHVVLPEPDGFAAENLDLVADFAAVLNAAGGRSISVSTDAELSEQIRLCTEGWSRIVSRIPSAQDAEPSDDRNTESLASVDIAIVPGRLGVAENGAVWLTEADLGARVLSVIAPLLVIVLPRDAIVPTMHEAYEALRHDIPGFGQFVAGPSKTADIEQSLVIGAHGAKETTVILVGRAP